MAKGMLKDRVLDDAREKAFKMSHLPESIKKSFNVSIKSGRVILSSKKKQNRHSGSNR